MSSALIALALFAWLFVQLLFVTLAIVLMLLWSLNIIQHFSREETDNTDDTVDTDDTNDTDDTDDTDFLRTF